MDRNLKEPPRSREAVEALWNFFATSRRKKLWHRLLDSNASYDTRIISNHETCRKFILTLIESNKLRRLSLTEIELAAYSLMQGQHLLLNNVETPPDDSLILSRCDCTKCACVQREIEDELLEQSFARM